MSDNELEEYLKTIEPNFDSHIEKGTIEMSNEYYNLLEERMIRLLNENKQLKEDKKKVREFIENKTTNERYGNLIGDEWYKKELHLSREELKDLLEILGDKENESN